MAMSLEERDIGATISGFLCSNLRFADDIALLTEGDRDLQSQVNNLHAVSTRFRLKISPSKTEVQCCSRDPPAIQINIDGSRLGQVEQFTYLGGVISCDNSSENDVGRRIGLATGASAALNTIWASKDITQETKLRVYRPLVLSILLYNSETWTLRESDKRRLLVFEMSVLRRILGVSRRDRRRNEDIRLFLGLSRNAVEEVQHRRLMYFGHVCRMKAARLPYITLFGRIHGSRPVGRPKKRWLDDVRTDCTELGLSMYQAVCSAQDRALWRRMLEELPRRTLVSQRP